MTLGELLCLGLDAAIVSIVYLFYKESCRHLQALKDAPTLEVTHSLRGEVGKLAEKCIPYVIVRGSVKAVEQPIFSKNAPGVAGVIHETVLREHKIQWSWASRWWREVQSDVSQATNTVPFVLRGNGAYIEIMDPLSAKGMEMATIFDEFRQNKPGLWESVSRFFIGETTTGYQNFEKMLLEGSTLTGVGKVALDRGRLCLSPPEGGLPYYLSPLTVGSLEKSLESDANVLKMLTVIFGTFGGVLLVVILARHYRKWRLQVERTTELKRMREMMEERNRRRRRDQRDPSDDYAWEEGADRVCVVCQESPRNVLFLECGHVCCCDRCGNLLDPFVCPVCRGSIDRIVPAFLS